MDAGENGLEENSSWTFSWPVTQPPHSGVSTKGTSCTHRSRDMYKNIHSNLHAVAKCWSQCPLIGEEINKLHRIRAPFTEQGLLCAVP